jgi:hypothetical protein
MWARESSPALGRHDLIPPLIDLRLASTGDDARAYIW